MVVLKLSQEQKMLLINEIQSYFEMERSETVGELAAGNWLDFMIRQLGPVIYNQALSDARAVVLQQLERAEEEIYALEQPVELRKSIHMDGEE